MAYGVFQTDDGKVHVIPCDVDGNILMPHVVGEQCTCYPEEHEDDERIIVHN